MMRANSLIMTAYIRKMHILPIGVSGIADYSSIYIKFLLNYLQIVSLINDYNLKIPNILDFVQNKFGNPV